jgi:NADH-quinone oxidoreductase subunit N
MSANFYFGFIPAYPEIFLSIMASVLLLADLFFKSRNRQGTYYIAQATLIGVGVLCAIYAGIDKTWYGFANAFIADSFAYILKAVSCLAVFLTLVYSRQYLFDRHMISNHDNGGLGGSFYAIALFALIGMFVMISGNSLLTIYLGLELLSLSLYSLVALRRDHAASTEASMKYFILGALASGFLLYGMSMLYGATGSLTLPDILKAVSSGGINKTVLVFGVVFIVCGLAFKLSAAPFHMWAPDVYDGAPTPVTLMIAGAPKLAAFAIAYRLLVEGLIPLAVDWQAMLVLLSVASLALGNIIAIAQTNIKRMLAYSTISHMGFLLLGLLSGVVGGSLRAAADAYSASMFYAIIYVLTTVAAFGVLMLLARKNHEADQLADFKGLYVRAPWAAGVLTVVMFSLSGIPPTAGFYAKLLVLQATVSAGQIWLAVLAVLFSLVGAFYYLRVVKLMFMDAATDTSPIQASSGFKAALSINAILLLIIGFFPSSLMNVCLKAITQALAN